MALIETIPVKEDYRRKMAYRLMQEASDANTPVVHWAQGLAKLGQGAIGGYMMRQADERDKETEAGNNAALIAALQGGGAAPAQPTPQRPTAQPQPAPMTSVNPQAGAVPAALAGKPRLDPTNPNGGMFGGLNFRPLESDAPEYKVASTEPLPRPETAPPTAAPAAPQAPVVPTEPQMADAKARIAAMLASDNPQMRKVGQGLAQKIIETQFTTDATPKYDFKTAGDSLYRTNSRTGAAEPIKDVGRGVRPMTEDERKQWKVPEGVAAGVDDNGKPSFSQPSNVNTVSPVISGINERFDAQMKTAQGAGQAIAGIHEARRALDSGAITGLGADPKLWAAKVGTMFGLPNEAVANTEKLGSAIGTQVLAHAKTLGANPSNADRVYIEKVMGSKQLDEASLRGLLDMQERWARDSVKRANDAGKKLISTDPEKLGRFAPMLSVDDPQSYDDYVKANPGSSPDKAALKKKYNLD